MSATPPAGGRGKALPVDLRSDTVTKPDGVMRAAMASAKVADDVLERDPTTRELEERCAQLLGMEAALWVPSGCMGNVIALFLHLRRGDRFLAPEKAHVLDAELGTASWLAGGAPQPLPWLAGPGRITPEQVRAATSAHSGYYDLATTLLCLENTHNAAGGAVVPVAEQAAVVAVARECGLRVHLDGARIWNAAVALGTTPAALTSGVDTVQACLSKGLGAPVGSVVAGSASFVTEARRVRKMLGGGTRQNGVLAAAGLVALDRIDRLAEDHENARQLGAGLAQLGWQVAPPETNMVFARVDNADQVISKLTEVGVLVLGMGTKVRFVTHQDVSAEDVKEVLERIAKLSD